MTVIKIRRKDQTLHVMASFTLSEEVEVHTTGEVVIDIDGAATSLTVADARRLSQALAGLLGIPEGRRDICTACGS